MRLRLSANPVLIKELRGRMRGPRAYLFLSATLGLLGLVTYSLYRLALFATQSYFGGGGSQGAVIGQSLFVGLVFVALIVICAVAPSLTAGAISGEVERKTYEMLMATPLRASSVLFGKLAVALSYTALILVAAVPLVSLSYVFGGVATVDMLQAFLLLVGFGLTFSAIGLFFSALFRRTTPAVLASYVVLAVFVFGTIMAYALYGATRQQSPPQWLLVLNPFSAMASALVDFASSTPNFISLSGSGYSGPVFGLLWLLTGGSIDPSVFATARPLWHYTLGIYLWLALALYLVSTQLVKPVRRFRLGRRGWAGVGVFAAGSILASMIVYGPLTPDRILAWIRWSTTSPRDLIVNGRFDAPLDQVWQIGTESEHDYESGGSVEQATEEGRSVVRFSREGTGHAETRIVQAVDQAIPADSWLQVRVVMRVDEQSLAQCGIFGSECPVMVKIAYEDARGNTHEWLQGFYATLADIDTLMPFPSTCTTCEFGPAHIEIAPGEWYTYESPNLLENLPPVAQPRRIRSITVAAAGHTYESQVAEVSLLLREGRPLDGGSPFGTPTPTPLPFGVMPFDGGIRVVPPPPPTPAPTATPF
jgi:ABC-type transport system involved in multi-copper enzyme maturation permease subunit